MLLKNSIIPAKTLILRSIHIYHSSANQKINLNIQFITTPMKHVFNVIILSLLPFLSFAQDLEFTLPISVSDGANTTNITVAVSPNGSSTSFVEGLDQLAPPAPPDGAFDARMKVNGTSYFTKYFDNALTAKTATFEYSASTGNGPITLTWDQSALDIVGTFTITDTFTGSFFTQSMNDLNGSYTIPNPGLIQSSFNLVFTPSGNVPDPIAETPVFFSKWWNLPR